MLIKNSLSDRGAKAAKTVVRVDLEIYGEALQDLYHPEDNPNGVLILNMAENNLSWKLLQDKIENISLENGIPDWVSNYTMATGAPSFRKAIAGFLEKFLTHCPIDPDHLACSAGATPVVEITTWILGNPGDVVVIPAPSYPVYTQDIGNKSALERFDLITHLEVKELKKTIPLNIEKLESAKKAIESKGKHFKILILTNPDNPTGGMYNIDQLQQIANWCIENKIHLVVNEIYGLSLINTQHPEIVNDYEETIEFESFAKIMAELKSNYLHLWYSLSKDLGSSGFRIGIVHSHNETLLKAYDNLNPPHMVSNLTQWFFEKILSDHHFIKNYIAFNQHKLTASYLTVIRQLRKVNIQYAPSRGSLFVWIDLSRFLEHQTKEAETQLWLDIYKKTKVLLTPADGFGNAKRGQFRLVYTAISKADLEVAMKRLSNYLGKIKQ